MGHGTPTPTPSPQILDSEPLMEVPPLCWCVGREELKIVKCKLCPDRFLISQTRKWRFREGKGLTPCHMIWFDEMSVGLGIGSLTSASNWCTDCAMPTDPCHHFRSQGMLLSLGLSFCPVWTAPGMSSSLSYGITDTHCTYLKACSVGSSFKTWHVRNLSGQL